MSEAPTLTRDQKRRKLIEAIDAREGVPSADHLRSLKEHGAETWGEYIVNMADEHGMRVRKVYMAFELLGKSEAFDGLVTTIEDEMGGEDE
jgi:hypothetical protein